MKRFRELDDIDMDLRNVDQDGNIYLVIFNKINTI